MKRLIFLAFTFAILTGIPAIGTAQTIQYPCDGQCKSHCSSGIFKDLDSDQQGNCQWFYQVEGYFPTSLSQV